MRRIIFSGKRRRSLLAVMIYGLTFPAHIFALPQGGQVVSGQANISQPGANQMNVQQNSNRAVINWNSFSIAAPETVQFVQPAFRLVVVMCGQWARPLIELSQQFVPDH